MGRFVGILVLLLFTVTACAGTGSIRSEGAKDGNQAPDFTLENLEGEKVSLNDFSGRVVLINFWATWCPPCRAEIPDIQAAYQSHQKDGVGCSRRQCRRIREAVKRLWIRSR